MKAKILTHAFLEYSIHHLCTLIFPNEPAIHTYRHQPPLALYLQPSIRGALTARGNYRRQNDGLRSLTVSLCLSETYLEPDICSFLPNTVHFDVNLSDSPTTTVPRSPSQVMLGNYRSPSIDLLTPSATLPTPAVPGATQDTQEFFLDGAQSAKDTTVKPTRPPMVSRISSIAGNETHSPAWGRNSYFTQPKSRAVSPPPQSILKHTRSPRGDENGCVRGASLEDIREDSRDRALQSADWVIQPAEQGNGGLRNAVNAALKTGALEHRIWVCQFLDPCR